MICTLIILMFSGLFSSPAKTNETHDKLEYYINLLETRGAELTNKDIEGLRDFLNNGGIWVSEEYPVDPSLEEGKDPACGCYPDHTNVIREVSGQYPTFTVSTYMGSSTGCCVLCGCFDVFKTRIYITNIQNTPNPKIFEVTTTTQTVYNVMIEPTCSYFNYITTSTRGGMGSFDTCP